jgi:hypothetical protein
MVVVGYHHQEECMECPDNMKQTKPLYTSEDINKKVE